MDRSYAGLRVGVDLTSVAEVEESVARFGDRYVRRVFTPHEIESCSRGGRESPRADSPHVSPPRKPRSKC